MRSVRLLLSLLALVGAMACGGGGSSRSTSITVFPSSLTFTAEQNGPTPPSQHFTFSFTGDGVIIGIPTGQTMPGWTSPFLSSQTSMGGSVAVPITTTHLDPGTYTMTLRFVAGLQDGSKLVTKDVTVTYKVNPEVPVLSLAAPALDFQGSETKAPEPRSVEIQCNLKPFTWALEVAADGTNPSDWLSVSSSGGVCADTRLTVQVLAALRVSGVYSAYLVLKDGSGREVKRLRATYNVGAGFTLSPVPALSLDQSSPITALTSGFDIHPTFNPTHGASVVWGLLSDQPWLNCYPGYGNFGADTHVTLLLDQAVLWSMPSGQHVAHLTLTVPGASHLDTIIPVTLSLNLSPALTVQDGPAIRVTPASTGASLGGQLQVGTNLGPVFNRAVSWTATSDAPWLQLTTSSGTTGTPGGVAFKVDGAMLANLPTQATAHVSIVAGTPGIAPATATIPLTMAFPKLDVVSPYVGWTGRPGPVVLRGSGFTTSGPFEIQVGGVPVTARIVDDTEARLDTPALAPAQRAPIRVANALGLDRGGPDLVVMDPPAYPTADLPCPSASELLLDPERNAVLAFSWQASQVTRHALKDGAWVTDAAAVPAPTAAAVSPDGKEILVMSGIAGQTQKLASHVDPATLNLRRSVPLPFGASTLGGAFYWNDGVCWLINTDQWASIWTYPENAMVPGFGYTYNMGGVMSLDRSVMVVGSTGGITPPDPQVRSVAGNGKVITGRVLNEGNLDAYASGMSRDGSRFVNQLSVYDAAFNRLGALTPEANVRCLAVSPDGATVFTSEHVGYGAFTFRRHPINAPAGPYPADATLPVVLPPGAVPMRMVVSQDGGTLFVLYYDVSWSPVLKVVPLN